jgi:hypothetical protein
MNDNTKSSLISKTENLILIPVNLHYLSKTATEKQKSRVTSNRFYGADTFICLKNFRPTSKLIITSEII